MTTKLYHRLRELDSQKNFYEGMTRVNIYHAVAKKAGVSVRDVADLAYNGPHSVGYFTSQKILAAVASLQGRPITENEALMLFANDTQTIERENSLTNYRNRWL